MHLGVQEYPASGFSSSLAVLSQADMQSIFDVPRQSSRKNYLNIPQQLCFLPAEVLISASDWAGCRMKLFHPDLESPLGLTGVHLPTAKRYFIHHSLWRWGHSQGKGTAVRVFSLGGCSDVVLHTHTPLTVGCLTLGICLYF